MNNVKFGLIANELSPLISVPSPATAVRESVRLHADLRKEVGIAFFCNFNFHGLYVFMLK